MMDDTEWERLRNAESKLRDKLGPEISRQIDELTGKMEDNMAWLSQIYRKEPMVGRQLLASFITTVLANDANIDFAIAESDELNKSVKARLAKLDCVFNKGDD